MVMQHQHRSDGGLHMYLGANVRPRDPREDKYHLRTVLPSGGADLSQPVVLSDYKGNDYRINITDQNQLGSCAAFTAKECTEMARKIAGQPDVPVHAGWLYEHVRMVEKSFPQDAGSYPADNLDIAIQGIPKDSLYQYVVQAGFQYPASMDADAPNQAYVASHHPFYPGDGTFLEDIWLSLSQGLPISLAMYWTQAMFNPVNGALPAGQTQAQAVGGHAITGWGCVPPANGMDGLVLCANHWTPGWNTAATGLGFGCRPGDFAIPWSYFKVTDSSALIFEARAVTGVALAPPNPNPPNPQPTGCKAAALAITTPVYNQLQAATSGNPTSRTNKYRFQGAKTIQDALQSGSF